MKPKPISTLALIALSVFQASPADVTVPGTANPWLAGMPNGSTSDGDTAPAQSPVAVPGLLLSTNAALTFTVSGGVGATPTRQPAPPDGGDLNGTLGIVSHRAGADNGIASLTAPVESLVGVFLGPEQPDLTPAPTALDFSTVASRERLVNRPLLKQVFFIGDGHTSAGARQIHVVPAGATRLFLGAMDGYTWNNNPGTFSVEATQVSVWPPPIEWPTVAGGNGHFYEGVCATGLTWTAASNAAVNAGGYLATIASQAENEFAFSVIDNDRFWHHFPGGNNHGPWLGGYQLPAAQEPGGGWMWLSGEAFTYVNWYAGEPTGSHMGTNENRLQYSSLSGTRAPTWNDLMDAPPIDWALYGFVVEYDQRPPTTPNIVSAQTSGGAFVLSWQRTGASASYYVESVQSLDQTIWLPVAPTNQWPVFTNVWAGPVSGATQGFYRVRAVWTY